MVLNIIKTFIMKGGVVQLFENKDGVKNYYYSSKKKKDVVKNN
jgi:hypothetical protein